MADQAVTCDMKNILLRDYADIVKKECKEDDLVEDKVDVSQTTIVMDNVELQDYAKHYNINKIKAYEVSTILDNMKTELPSSTEQCVLKKEEGVSTDDIRIEFDNGLLYCELCEAYYEDYCIECKMLVHILNRNAFSNADNSAREELPNDILEIQDVFGQFGIFALKVIPEGVKFGPFIGLSRINCPWKIKTGKFVVNSDKLKYMNWMQYINPANNVSEQNLHVFQCEDNLYYRSTRKIQGGEELLVYFGEEYEDSLNKDVEVDFIPNVEYIVTNVFACTFCCLGFSSRTYLTKHKAVCLKDAAEEFSIEDLTQCPFCNIHLDQREYYEHHMAYCCERNVKKCVPFTTPGNQPAEVRGRKTRFRHLYKCGQCNYRTKYKADLKNHTNQHYKVKSCKCEMCCRRFKTRESLRLHVENTHIYGGGKADPERQSTSGHKNAHVKAEHSKSQFKMKQLKCSPCRSRTKHKQCLKSHIKTHHLNEFDYKCDSCDLKRNNKSDLEKHIKAIHLKEFDYKCDLCDYKRNRKEQLETHVKTKHCKVFNYKCDMCDYKTNYKLVLDRHLKEKHLKKFDYVCDVCDYKTNHKGHFKIHMKTKHMKVFNYKCDMCDYKTKYKLVLDQHLKAKHLKKFDCVCDVCDYKTNHKGRFKIHMKTKHLKEFDYKCDLCDYKTNRKEHLETHVKTKHLKVFNYKCDICDFKTSSKSNLEKHIKTIHLKEFDYKCDLCDYETNYKGYLETHIKTKHLMEFNYKCDMCDYKTNRKRHFKMHMKTKHLKVFNYKCNMCDYKTNYKLVLHRHLKAKHS